MLAGIQINKFDISNFIVILASPLWLASLCNYDLTVCSWYSLHVCITVICYVYIYKVHTYRKSTKLHKRKLS